MLPIQDVLEKKHMEIKKRATNQINQINKLNFNQINQIIQRLPFQINPAFAGAVAKHLIRIGLPRFNQCVEAAKRAYNPERYLMRCLVNENRLKGCDPQTGSQSNFTG